MLGLVGGGLGHAAGSSRLGDGAWIGATGVGVVLSVATMVRSLRARRLGVDVIALLALLGALGVREYLAGAVISVMLGTGQALEDWATGRARRELAALLGRAPKLAHRYRDGSLDTVALEEVAPGERLMVATGEVVPVDGTVLSPSAVLDESALTGEALPVTRVEGDPVRSGVLNAGAPFDLLAVASAEQSTFSGVVRLVQQAESTQAPFVRLADRYAVIFLFVSLATAGLAWALGGPARAVDVLVVSTPCPMILAAPAAFISGLSRAARRGIIVKSGAVLERLAGASTLLIDKTGTVTRGHPELAELVLGPGQSADVVLSAAGSLDQMSPHVVASAVVRAALDHAVRLEMPRDVEEVAGSGIRGLVAGRRVAVGNERWVGLASTPAWARAARRRARREGSLLVYVALEGEPVGLLVFSDPLRHDSARTIRALRQSGIRRVVLVTGDRSDVAETIGSVIGVDEVLAERQPAEKLDVVRLEARRGPTIMVGDGINDAPALAMASVGVAMGARGASAASEAADVVLTVDRLDRLAEALRLARRTRRIATQSVLVGMGLSLAAMLAATIGWLPAVAGAILQELIDAGVIVNALRALRPGPQEARLTTRDSRLAQRFQEEHRAVRAVLDQLHQIADDVSDDESGVAVSSARRIHQRLVDEVLAHELAEEAELYPALERFLGGADPLSTMSRAHTEIAHRIRRLGQLLDELETDAVDVADVVDLRSMLYGLHAILSLHTAQEEESYLSLGEE